MPDPETDLLIEYVDEHTPEEARLSSTSNARCAGDGIAGRLVAVPRWSA